jgi:TRAP-type C4-dicarboxylate transport system permease small subunit
MTGLRLKIGKISKVIYVINKILTYISIWTLAGAGLIISLDVVLRSVFKAPIPAATEITIILIPYVTLFPFAYTLINGQHVRVSLLTDKFSLKGRAITDAIAYTAALIYFIILFWYSWLYFWESFVMKEIMPAIIKVPWWVGKLAMPIGILMIAIQCILSFIGTFNPKEKK